MRISDKPKRAPRHRASAPTTSGGAEERIAAAALRCFNNFGYAKTTINDIADEAGIARMTIYRHYENKAAIAEDIAIKGVAEINSAVANRLKTIDDVLERIVEAMATSIEYVTANKYLRSLLQGEMASLMTDMMQRSAKLSELESARWQPILSDAQNAGRLPRDMGLDELQDWLMMTMIALISRWPAKRYRSADLRAALRKFVINGVAARQA